MLLILFAVIRFQYFEPNQPVFTRLSLTRTSGNVVTLEKIGEDSVQYHFEITKGEVEQKSKARIEEIAFDSLPAGLYFLIVNNDTTVFVVTNLNITTNSYQNTNVILATIDNQPVKNATISIVGDDFIKGLKTNVQGIAQIVGQGQYLLSVYYNDYAWVGEISTKQNRVKKRISIVPFGVFNKWFRFSCIYDDNFQPIKNAPVRADLVNAHGLSRVNTYQTDRYGSIVDSILFSSDLDRLILIANDIRSVYSFKGLSYQEKCDYSTEKISTSKFVYRPGDTLQGVFNNDSIQTLNIIDPIHGEILPNFRGNYFWLPVTNEGRYQIIGDVSPTYFWVGRRGALSAEQIPILLTPKYLETRPGEEVAFMLRAPLQSGVLLYQFGNKSGIVQIKDGIGKIKISTSSVGKYKLTVKFRSWNRLMQGEATLVVSDKPAIYINPEPLIIKTDQEARLAVSISPTQIRDSGIKIKVGKNKSTFFTTATNRIVIDPPAHPGNYIIKVVAFGLQGFSTIEKIINVY